MWGRGGGGGHLDGYVVCQTGLLYEEGVVVGAGGGGVTWMAMLMLLLLSLRPIARVREEYAREDLRGMPGG